MDGALNLIGTSRSGRQMPLRLSVLCTMKCKSATRVLASSTSVAAIRKRMETTTVTNFFEVWSVTDESDAKRMAEIIAKKIGANVENGG